MKKNILNIIYEILAFFTRIYIKRTNPFVIWITWSVWKTSCRMIVFQILEKYIKGKKIYTSPKNFNSELWLVFSIFKIEKFNPWIKSLIKVAFKIIKLSIFWKKQYEVLLLEYWVDHPWDMDFLLTIVKPNISVFTKLDSIHIENFQNINQILKVKIKLIDNSKDISFLNYKDNYLKNIFDSIKWKKQYYWKQKVLWNYLLKGDNIVSEINFWKNIIQTNILGEENYLYIELWFKILDYLKINYPLDNYLELKNQWWRFSIFKWVNNSILIDSTYNAWPESMKKMIENTISIRDNLFSDYKLWFIMWDMRELWKYSEEKHKEIFDLVKNSDLLLSIWKETKKYFWKQVKNFISSKEAWKYLKEALEKTKEKYVILFKWSQNTIFCEEALKEILKDKNDIKKLVRQETYWEK